MARLAFLLGADDPENVAQESFARLHTRWSQLRQPAKALPYLRAMVVNLSRSRLRHLKVGRRVPSADLTNAESAEAAVLHCHGPLWMALKSLTVRQRQVIVLGYWLDLPIAEVAADLGVSVGTVKATLAQSVDKLRNAIRKEDE